MTLAQCTSLVSDLNHAILSPHEPAPPGLLESPLTELCHALKKVRRHWTGTKSGKLSNIPSDKQVAELYLLLRGRSSRVPAFQHHGKALYIFDFVGEELEAA